MIDLEALAQRISAVDTSIPVMIDTMPIAVTKGIFLRSSISGDDIDYEIPGLAQATFRLIVRSAKYDEGQKLLAKAIRAIRIEYPEEVGSMHVRYCRPETTPMVFPVSDGNLREFAVNMLICYDYDYEESAWGIS